MLNMRRWRRGLALWMLFATGCSGSVATPTANPSRTSTPENAQNPLSVRTGDEFCPPPRGWFLYEVQPGDTLRSIAERTSSTIAELATANCLQNPTRLNSGIILFVPARPVG